MDIRNNIKGHFNTITTHKMEVMKLCFKAGLYKQGLLHDLSKYSPAEFITGVLYYSGDKSPNTNEKLATGKSTGIFIFQLNFTLFLTKILYFVNYQL